MLDKLIHLDRRWIFLVVGLAVVLPLLFPIPLPVEPSVPSRAFYKVVSDLPADSLVCMSFDYGPGTKVECHPMALAMLHQLFQKRCKVVAIALWPEGALFAREALNETGREMGLQEGIDYVNLGFKDGGEVVLRGVADDFRNIYSTDLAGHRVDDIPLMKRVRGWSSFALVALDNTDTVLGNKRIPADVPDCVLNLGGSSFAQLNRLGYSRQLIALKHDSRVGMAVKIHKPGGVGAAAYFAGLKVNGAAYAAVLHIIDKFAAGAELCGCIYAVHVAVIRRQSQNAVGVDRVGVHMRQSTVLYDYLLNKPEFAACYIVVQLFCILIIGDGELFNPLAAFTDVGLGDDFRFAVQKIGKSLKAQTVNVNNLPAEVFFEALCKLTLVVNEVHLLLVVKARYHFFVLKARDIGCALASVHIVERKDKVIVIARPVPDGAVEHIKQNIQLAF